jgi:hypothetical protein
MKLWSWDKKIVPAEPIAPDDCFIRVKNLKDSYLHPGQKNEYKVQKGKNGAAVWKLREAVLFIQVSGIPDLEPEVILPVRLK